MAVISKSISEAFLRCRTTPEDIVLRGSERPNTLRAAGPTTWASSGDASRRADVRRFRKHDDIVSPL
jgi:hypothetical protein